jgi:hypothetical protein
VGSWAAIRFTDGTHNFNSFALCQAKRQKRVNRSAEKESAMIKALFAAKRPTLATLLARADDHLLDDIGLTRFDVETLLREGTPAQSRPRFAVAHA